ncbi:hypothetical protein GGS23DRAFT_119894 [Durotheca rogersii]|uniref:uncharacterized protein n=1 Tax=Durotheca rogersii TaxID=419775 RepID=UPI00221EF80D|nr:uncharacterized protein GGS23DRAFT_119894 [Durotheca rogersii]KAI5861938.1 hypothetical protein GGS23DRAFT_119894 [Durotheca rogersii]
MPSHKHLHRRQGGSGRDDLITGAQDVVNELTPLKETPTLAGRAPAPETIFKTVYTTMSPTFEGQIGGYSTVGRTDEDPETAVAPTTTRGRLAQTTATEPKDTGRVSLAQVGETTSTAKKAEATKTELPQSIVPTGTFDTEDHSTLALAKSTPGVAALGTAGLETTEAAAATNAVGADAAATASTGPSSSTTAEAAAGVDTSGAAKAGIAIGVLGGILVVGLLIFFLFSKRRKQLEKQRLEDDEKVNGQFGARPVSVQTTATAPQLSLRPVTEFMPVYSERRSSKGAAIALATSPASATTPTTARSPWERPATGQANNPENPFGNHAESAYTPTSTDRPRNPFDAPENVVGVAQTTDVPPKSSPVPTAAVAGAVGAGAGLAAGAAAGGALVRQASTRKHAPAPLDLTVLAGPPSPAGTEFSVNSVSPGQSPGPSNSAAAIAAAGGPASSTVHRAQLDFNPTMDDEMGLRAGQLVRLLHEYDDGWALCIRLDRSQQGVVPRTCLSTRPVKPRPAGGPPGSRPGPPVVPNGQRGPRTPGPYPPGQRPMTPQGGPPRPMTAGGRPQSPATMRPQSPATGRPMSPYRGPMSPGPRPQSPGQGPQSPSTMGRRMTPPGPSPMNPNGGAPSQQPYQGPPQGPVGRKPVPGQAY